MSDTSSSPPDGQHTNKILAVAFVTMFLDLVGFGLIIPIQPFYAESFGASAAMVTLLGGAYSAMQFLFIPMWGRIGDRIGRRPVILISVLISCIGHLYFGFAGSLGALFAARFLTGFGNANIATVQALVADSTSGHDRTRGMGLIGAAFGLGFVVGPAIGGFLVHWGLAVPAFAAAAMALFNFCLAFMILPETNRFRQRKGEQKKKALSTPQVIRVSRNIPNVWTVTSLRLISAFGFSIFEQAMGLFVERVWVHIPPDQMAAAQQQGADAVRLLHTAAHKQAASYTAMILVVMGVVTLIVQGGLIGKLSRRYGERALVRVGLPVVAVGMVLFVWVGHAFPFWAVFPTVVVMAVGRGLTNPSLMSLLSQCSPPNIQGSILGIAQSASSLGRVAGPSISGVLFEINMNVPELIGGAVLLAGFAISVLLVPPAEEPEAVDIDMVRNRPY